LGESEDDGAVPRGFRDVEGCGCCFGGVIVARESYREIYHDNDDDGTVGRMEGRNRRSKATELQT
jgi:hypothetical protein